MFIRLTMVTPEAKNSADWHYARGLPEIFINIDEIVSFADCDGGSIVTYSKGMVQVMDAPWEIAREIKSLRES